MASKLVARLHLGSRTSKFGTKALPRGLHGDVDAPTPHDRLDADQLVGGWVVDELGPPFAIHILLNGLRVAQTRINHERPDIAPAFPTVPHASWSGWNAVVDMTLARGAADVTLAIEVVRADHSKATLATITRLRPPAHDGEWCQIDEPHHLQVVRHGYVHVRGRVRTEVPIDGVDVRVDGVDVGQARTYSTTDIEDPQVIGFEHAIRVDQRCEPDATAQIGVTARRIDSTAIASEEVTMTIHSAEKVTPAELERLQLLQARTTLAIEHAHEHAAPRVFEKVRLAVFTHHLGLGGAQLWLQDLLRGLMGSGDVACSVFAPADGVLRDELEDLGIPVHVTDVPSVSDPLAYEGRIAELSTVLQSSGANVALANTALTYWGVDAAQRVGLPSAWGIHESFPLEQLWIEAFPPGAVHPYIKRRAELALREASLLIFEADATRVMYEPLAGSSKHTVTLPYGAEFGAVREFVEQSDRSAIRADLGFEPSDQVVLCLGTIEPRKGQLLLAQAFQLIKHDFPHAKLALVGDTGSKYADAVRSFAERHLPRTARVVRVTPDTYDWYLAADVLISTSDVESLPRSVLEAMAFGRPVAATSIFGLPELIADGETGILFEPRSMTAAAGALSRVLSMDQDDLREMGRRGAALVLERHDPQRYVRNIRRALDRLVAEPWVLPR